jgi:hypothetical protein
MPIGHLRISFGAVRSFFITYDRTMHYSEVRGFDRLGDYHTRILLLIDGLPINENIFGAATIGTDAIIDVALIDRVEIIRGPRRRAHLGGVGAREDGHLLFHPSEGRRATNMTIDNPVAYCRVLEEGVDCIPNSYSMDAPVRKVWEPLDKELESAISNDSISFRVSCRRNRDYA